MSFSTLLVANRGEIALRVIRAARARGLRTVAVYSDADRGAPHTRAADAAVRLGPTPASESYMNIPAILAAARATGAEAIHPGYGFLSEHAPFARAVTEAGLVFVGPSADVIEAMGRKDAARELAIQAGVPVVPSVAVTRGGAQADGLEFPVLIKAAAGGGGKGMRIVRTPAEFDASFDAAEREAQKSFGDATLLVERYLPDGRHVEVQVLADAHGNVVHLFERDCSTQRRHQKVLEEAPAPTISETVREQLTSASVALAKTVGYTNAGTVEFLVAGEDVFFLEMNTRIQVEHPVTELITGLDLVQLQLAVAAGEPLAFAQQDVRMRGHAIEARVYAEDPFNGYLPQTGTVSRLVWPADARVDTALEEGQRVGTAYDPMLAKVIVHGPSREVARRVLIEALGASAIVGVTTNLGFLRALADSAGFRDASITTSFLDVNPGAVDVPDATIPAVFATWALARATPATRHPFGVADGWRMGQPAAPWSTTIAVDAAATRVSLDRAGGRMVVGDSQHSVSLVDESPERLRLEIDGGVHAATVVVSAHGADVSYLGQSYRLPLVRRRRVEAAAQASNGVVLSPMPGVVLSTNVAVGETVEAGSPLGIIEAMKMELSLTAPISGVVTEVGASKGQQVKQGDRLFVVEE
ncbi:ATP-grasp domain-containing protein [Salinibacterium sp. dk2585]|uniref:acetyl/propionyl/methylcrotonyl-CoA carboxylase subunit alpha n=1 Tax=unclassified Salinibacterium TaxID=2632331 RepID=UPI0011C24FCB|nr:MULTISPECIES: biotin carboxylase N-terminal domain-containing protein [unclassified Salinibacterium]QEE62202.1 ATP-grasp domain-containing protein [Salinibacterium sp. dk2585]TXK53554.1 ATP-grasp domain-containing protein [Salinibacterium sp. dk5596]